MNKKRIINKNKQRKKSRAHSKLLLRNQRRADKFKEELKINKTKAEKRLYTALKQRGIKFQFQKAYFSVNKLYIIDFWFKRKKNPLAVEVDGSYHNDRKYYDKKRDEWLKEHRNCEVLRVSNDEVLYSLDAVIKKIISKGIRFNPNFSQIIPKFAYKNNP